jgi:phospholipid transport system substrate-binding protein
MRYLIALSVLVGAGLASTFALGQEAPVALVKRVATEVSEIIKSDKDIQAGNQQKIKDLIESKLVPNFDSERMTALAMGRNWSKATPEQQKQLVDQFRTLLIRTYSGALANYRDNKIVYKPLQESPTGNEVVVKTQVTQPGSESIPIDYKMEKTPDGWKAYDVSVGGVSLVTNYRDEFSTAVQASGIDGLIRTLAEKNKGIAAGAKK